MYHSLDFKMLSKSEAQSISFNTYKDLFLVPTSRPVINPPAVKTKTIEVPGANGSIDLTDSLTPYPVYNNRTGSIEFAVLNDKMDWAVLYSKIMNYIHGRKGRMILEDDPGWYYEGRWSVGNWTSNNDGTWSTVSLDYDLYPYKLEVATSIEGSAETGSDRWKWSPFSFVDGVIFNLLEPTGWSAGVGDSLFKNIPVDSDDWVSYGVFSNSQGPYMSRKITGWMPVCPKITVSAANMGVRLTDAEQNPKSPYLVYEKTYDNAGSYTDPQLILYDWSGNGYRLYLKGHGTVTIEFRRGSL